MRNIQNEKTASLPIFCAWIYAHIFSLQFDTLTVELPNSFLLNQYIRYEVGSFFDELALVHQPTGDGGAQEWQPGLGPGVVLLSSDELVLEKYQAHSTLPGSAALAIHKHPRQSDQTDYLT